MTATGNNRIAKNTIYLYLRMLMVMAVSLYTVRVVINALGAEDYGINNVVGGIVAMFTFLNSILTSASLRFFAINIGKSDQEQLNSYFTMSFWCYAIVSVIVIVLAETIGLWFFFTQMNIPSDRMDAALWVYQFSILTFVVNLLVIPYSTIVIAHEKMNMYAVLGIIECLLKLAVAYIIVVAPFDRLKTYAVLMFLMMVIVDIYYVIYGFRNFEECRIRKFWNNTIFKEIAGFSSWTLFGAVSGVLRSQGINILLNIFFNPIVNAARAIAYQVNGCATQFVLSFYKAVQPQITKNYGAGESDKMQLLVLRSSRYCFYLILILSMPVLLETEFLLSVWLKEVPEYTVMFTRLTVITAVIDSTSYPLQTAISATGKVKYFQIVTGGLLLLILPVSWWFLELGYPAEVTMYISIVASIIAQMARIYFTNRYTGLSVEMYIKDVLWRILLVVIVSVILPIATFTYMEYGAFRFISVGALSVISCIATIYFAGIPVQERQYFNQLIKRKVHAF